MAVNIDDIAKRKPKPAAPKGDEAEGADVEASEKGGEDSYESVEGDAIDALAKTLRVPAESWAAFGEALTDLVEACAKRILKSRE